MNIPFMTTVVCVNENLRTWLRPWDRQQPIAWYFLCAGAAGACAAVATNPLDVIKTRLQTQEVGRGAREGEGEGEQGAVKYRAIR